MLSKVKRVRIIRVCRDLNNNNIYIVLSRSKLSRIKKKMLSEDDVLVCKSYKFMSDEELNKFIDYFKEHYNAKIVK